MTEPRPDEGTNPQLPHDAPRRADYRALRRIAPWLVGALALLLVAGAGGLGAAYVVATLRAAPTPDAAFLPTPTPTVAPTVAPTVPPPAEPTAEPTAEPASTPTAAPTEEPTAEPTPGPTPFVYTVVRGDTVSRIAIRFGVTPEEVIALNELRNPNRIRPGQQLLIPVASATPGP